MNGLKGFFVCGSLIACMLLFALPRVFAQVRSGTFYGVVSDQSGARMPGAKIAIVKQDTGVERDVTSGADGSYTATTLPIGTYTIRASANGFQPTEVGRIVLEIDDRREVNITLSVASANQSVSVSDANPAVIETTTSSLGQVVHEENVVTLPLNGRDFVQLGTLTAGAVHSDGTQFNNPSASTSIRGTTSLSVSGMRENTNDWLLDGVDNNELTAGSISILPSIDAIQEFKVLTNNYSAEYGRNGGGTVLITSRAGSNALHGSLFEFVRNDIFDAQNFFSGGTKPTYRQNQFGGSLGGPIKKDKLFYFMDYQGNRIRKQIPQISTVPTKAMDTGDFSQLLALPTPVQIFDPCATVNPGTDGCASYQAGARTQFAFNGNPNVIPASRLDPVALKLLALFPLPNVPGIANGTANNFLYKSERSLNDDQFDLKIDHTISSADSYFVRFSFDDAHQFYPGPLPGFGGGSSSFVSSTLNQTNARNLAIAETHIFSQNLVNQALLGYNRVFINIVGPSYGQNISAQLGIPGANLGDAFTSGLTRIDLSSYNGLGDRLTTPLELGTNVFQYSDSLTWIRGHHTINVGGGVLFNQMNNIAIAYPRGNMQFTNLFTSQVTGGSSFVGNTGSSIASLLLGLPAVIRRSNAFGGPELGNRWRDPRFYFQDDWRITQSLTLNLGLAYEVITPMTEANNKLAFFNPATGTMTVAGKNGAGASAGVQTDFHDGVQPRLGFAFTPFASRKLVIRGGYGIFNDIAIGGLQGPNPPFLSSPESDSNSIAPVGTLDAGYPTTAQQNPNSPSGTVWFLPSNYKMGLVQQWNFGIEQQLPGQMVLGVSYVGSKADHLLDKLANFNSPAPGAGTIAARRPFPNLGTITSDLSVGWDNYHALQARIEKGISHNLYFLGGYTYSKSLGNAPPESLTFQSGAEGAIYYPFMPLGRKTDKGLADIDFRHNFTMSYIYSLPVGKGERFLGSASGFVQETVGDWQLSGIIRMRSGYPLGATMATSSLNNTMTNRPNQTCNGALANRKVSAWFNVACFSAPASFQFGNAGRTFGGGPSQYNFDLSFLKDIAIHESMKLQFRAEIYNLFNTPQFDLPNTTIGSSQAGTITATINDNRQVQFSLKLNF